MKRTKDNRIILNFYEHGVLVEALRRRSRFNDHTDLRGEQITRQWTGLGCMTVYKAALKSGLMELATPPNPGHDAWWRLTERGARIVCYWLGCGYDYKDIEGKCKPSATIPATIW